MAFFSSGLPSMPQDLFSTCDDILELDAKPETPLYTPYNLDGDFMELEPLSLDEKQIATSDFELLGDLTALLD